MNMASCLPLSSSWSGGSGTPSEQALSFVAAYSSGGLRSGLTEAEREAACAVAEGCLANLNAHWNDFTPEARSSFAAALQDILSKLQ